MAIPTEIAAGVNGGAISATYTLNIPNGSNAAIGDLIIVIGTIDSTSALSSTSITDNATGSGFGSNTWTIAAQTVDNSAHRLGVWYSVLTTAWTGGTSKVRLTTGGSDHKTLLVWQLPLVTSVSLDRTVHTDNQATTTTPVTGTTAATTQATELAVSAFLFDNAPVFTAPTGWTQTATTMQTVTGSACSQSAAYKNLGVTGTQSATATLGVTEPSGGLLVTFKYTDADEGGTVTGVAVISASESQTLFDEGSTVSGVAVPSGPDVANIGDTGTSAGVAAPSATDTAAFVESGTGVGVAAPSALEGSSYPDAAIAAGVAIPSAAELQGKWYLGTGTDIIAVTMAGAGSYHTPTDDLATAQGIAAPLATDFAAFVDAGSTTGTSLPSFTQETEQSVESATVFGVANPSAVETTDRTDAGTVTSTGLASGNDTAIFVDAATEIGVAFIPSGAEGTGALDFGMIHGLAVISASEMAAFIDAGSVASTAIISAIEGSQPQDIGIVIGIGILGQEEHLDSVDAGKALGVSIITGFDAHHEQRRKIILVWQHVGPPSTPQDVRRLRRQNLDLCKRMGQPAVFRHMWNLNDVAAGLAKKCPLCYNGTYQQVRNNCLGCYGVGYVSTELSEMYWDEFGNYTNTITSIPASVYGGFDKPMLTWLVEPDVAVDVFKINQQGVMVKTYDATGVAPWYPQMGDNDLCINAVLNRGGVVVDETARFQLKMVQQITVRGFGAKSGLINQPYQIAQSFQMAHIPDLGNNILKQVPREPHNDF